MTGECSSMVTYTTQCLWFCFNEVIQHDLDFIKLHWNTHYICPSRHDTIPGKPDELFFLPECCGVEDQLCPVSETQVHNIVPQYDLVNPILDNDHQEYFKCVCNLQGLSASKHWHESLSLFLYLTTLVE